MKTRETQDMRPLTRVTLLISLGLIGCNANTNVMDMAACLPHAVGNAPHSCGPMTCSADEFCIFEQYGACSRDLPQPVDDDGGGGLVFCGQYQCGKLPSSCDCNQLCGPNGQVGPPGCLRSLPSCQYATGCRLDGATVTCIDN
jgi:hypothetical protein